MAAVQCAEQRPLRRTAPMWHQHRQGQLSTKGTARHLGFRSKQACNMLLLADIEAAQRIADRRCATRTLCVQVNFQEPLLAFGLAMSFLLLVQGAKGAHWPCNHRELSKCFAGHHSYIVPKVQQNQANALALVTMPSGRAGTLFCTHTSQQQKRTWHEKQDPYRCS